MSTTHGLPRVKFTYHNSPPLLKTLIWGSILLLLFTIIFIIWAFLSPDWYVITLVFWTFGGTLVMAFAAWLIYKIHKSEIKTMNKMIEWLNNKGKASAEEVATGLNTNDINATKEFLQELTCRGLVKITFTLGKEKQLYELKS